ncbi:MAG: hypothetical protein V4675_15980 [Verrucomicrobiota bacterium]
MKKLILSVAGWLLPGVAILPARTFTSTDGRTLEGEIRAANEKEVTIKRTVDGREVKVSLSVLIPAHQQEVAAWLQVKSLTKLTFTATKDKETSNTRATGGSTAVNSKDQTWSWVITVKNGSAFPVSGLSLEWAQVVERTDRNQGAYAGPSKTIARRSIGTVPVPDIPAFGSVKVKTEPIVVQSMKSLSYSSSTSASGDRVTEVTSYKWDEALSGLGLSLLKGNERVVRWKTGTDPGATPLPLLPGQR